MSANGFEQENQMNLNECRDEKTMATFRIVFIYMKNVSWYKLIIKRKNNWSEIPTLKKKTSKKNAQINYSCEYDKQKAMHSGSLVDMFDTIY